MSLTSVNKLENNTVELQIQVSEEQFQDALVKAYKKKVKSIALPGFRKGKAPKAMIEKMYNSLPIINLLFAISPFPIGSVEPHFMHFSIVGKQLRKLLDEEPIIGIALSVTFGIAIPG